MNSLNKRLYKAESAAFVELYDRLGERLYGFVYSQLGSRQDASDVVQEVFVRLVKSHRALAKADNLNGYVFTIARNEVIRWLKKNKRNGTTPWSEDQSLGNTTGETGKVETSIESSDWVNHQLGRLAPQDREIVQLKVFSQLTFKEIATATGLQESNVATRYRRAMARLESQIGSERPVYFANAKTREAKRHE